MRKPDTPCSGCGTLLFTGKGSRPQPLCRPCRRQRPSYKARSQPWIPGQRICPVCQASFTQQRHGQRYCSRPCHNRRPASISEAALERRRARDRERDKQRPRLHGRVITKPCEGCGEPFSSRPVDKQRYCSRQCAAQQKQSWPASKLNYGDCAECGRVFIARWGRKFCGDACARDGDRRRRGHDPARACNCGAVLPSPQRQKCDDCLERSRKEQRQRKKRAERARKRGVIREPYTLAEIAERDRYHCQLCQPKRKVAMTKVVPHPKAPTIDHVIPLDAGGDDTKVNVQLAHFLCNAKKCTGGSQQLRIVG